MPRSDANWAHEKDRRMGYGVLAQRNAIHLRPLEGQEDRSWRQVAEAIGHWASTHAHYGTEGRTKGIPPSAPSF